MHVPFNDLARQVASMREQIETAVAAVLDSGWFINGPQCQGFESDFAQYCGVKHCIGVANGTDALEIALRALGCCPGDEVVTVANAGMYTTTAALIIGATPVYAEIELVTLEMDTAILENLLSARTKAIVATHLYGQLGDMDAVLRIARSNSIPVVEDCAQAHGATRDGRRAGSFGDVATFSFYPTKNLGACGDGGAVLTQHDDTAERVRALRQYGWKEKYHAIVPLGRNSRLDELQAAILRVKLPFLDTWNARRREIVCAYRDAASGTRLAIVHDPDAHFVAHLCVGLHPEREAFRVRLAAHGIETSIHYPIPDHRQPALANAGWRSGSLEATEAAARSIVSLPCFPELTDSEVDYVCSVVSQAD